MSFDSDRTFPLRNKRILIIEDDSDLAGRLESVFINSGSKKPYTAHWVEEALGELRSAKRKYDLIIIDVMLPETEEHFHKIEEQKREITRCRRIFQESETAEDKREDVTEARVRRQTALQTIKALIDENGGLKVVERWRKENPQMVDQTPILFLTAVGEKAASQRGLALAKKSAWLVKPITVQTLMNTAAGLLSS